MASGKRRLGLRIRFTLLVSALLIITFVAIAFFLVRNAQSTDIRNINQDSKAFSALATPQIGNAYAIYGNSGSIIIQQQIQSYTSLDSDIANVAVIDLNGHTAFKDNSAKHIASFSQSNSFSTQYIRNNNGLISQVLVPYLSTDGEHPYSIAYVINTSVLSADNQRQIKDIIFFSVIGLIATALIMYELISRFYIRPIERMSREAITISKGNYDTSVDASRNDEIGDLAGSVNTMSERLKADIQALKEVDRLKSEFITITSHNLRTPLTIIEGIFETLQSEDLPKEIAEPLQNVQRTANELAGFAEDMLAISTIEAGESFTNKSSTTIEQLVEPLRKRFDPIAKGKSVKIDWQIAAPETPVKLAASYTRSILRSLLDNAIKFTNGGGTVTCQISLVDKVFKIVVSDSGIGISKEEQTKLFTKFHRGTSTMEYNYRGTGIGLYVAKLMTESQQGTIQAVSEEGKGSTFTVTIPQ